MVVSSSGRQLFHHQTYIHILCMLPLLGTSALTLAAAAPMEMHIARVPVSSAVSRRAALGRLFLVAPAVLYGQSAAAFDNRLPPDELELKYKTPRTPGPKPTDIGPRPGGLLKPCNDGKPHCFSSTPDPADADLDPYESAGATEGWLVSPFKYDKPLADAVTDVKSAIAAYPPGQAGIDGGGFKVAVEQAKGEEAYYIYVLFESRRRGCASARVLAAWFHVAATTAHPPPRAKVH